MPKVCPRIRATELCSVLASGVPPSARGPRARRKRALLHALHLPLLRNCHAKARHQPAYRATTAHTSLAAVPAASGSCASAIGSLTGAPIASLAVGGPRWCHCGKELKRAAGRPTPRSPALAHTPSFNARGNLVSPTELGFGLQGIGLADGTQMGRCPVLRLFGIFLLGKKRREQPDGRGSLGQAREMLGRHRDRLLSTATT
jgi:hypothetical protein